MGIDPKMGVVFLIHPDKKYLLETTREIRDTILDKYKINGVVIVVDLTKPTEKAKPYINLFAKISGLTEIFMVNQTNYLLQEIAEKEFSFPVHNITINSDPDIDSLAAEAINYFC